MNSIIFSERVLHTLGSLPSDERSLLTHALVDHLVLGKDPTGELTPLQNMIYTILRHYVEHDSRVMSGLKPVAVCDLNELAV